MIGKKIKQVVQDLGMSCKEVGQAIGLSASGVHGLFDRDSVETKYIEKLSELADIPMWEFFDERFYTKPSIIEAEKAKRQALFAPGATHTVVIGERICRLTFVESPQDMPVGLKI